MKHENDWNIISQSFISSVVQCNVHEWNMTDKLVFLIEKLEQRQLT